MTIFVLLDLIRAVAYLITAFECLILSRDYQFGYDKVKGSHIIRALARLFQSLAIAFSYYLFLPIVKTLNYGVYQYLAASSVLPIIFIIYSLDRFRYWSLNQKEE